MCSELLPIKDSIRFFCPYCIKIKNRSRTFHTFHAIKYHLNSHEEQNLLFPDCDFVNIIKNVEKAAEFGLVRVQ